MTTSNLPSVLDASRAVQQYNPDKGLKTVVIAEATEKYLRGALRNDPSDPFLREQLSEVIKRKITEQAAYVVWRDSVARPAHRPSKNSFRTESVLPAADPGDVKAHRWRKNLCCKSDAGTQIDLDKIRLAVEDAARRAVSICEQEKGDGITTGVAMAPYAERGLDLHETPAPATWALLSVEKFHGPIWEPANGRGAISRVLRAAGHRVIATDIADYGVEDARGGVDFLAQTAAPEGVRDIITNPPFMHADECVRHALRLVPRVTMLLRLLFLESTGRSDIIDSGHLRRIHVFRERIAMPRVGQPGNYDQLAFAWFVFDRDYNGPWIGDRISCCQGPAEAPYRPIDGSIINKLVVEGFKERQAAGGPRADYPELPNFLVLNRGGGS
jgi:hypothetical protein